MATPFCSTRKILVLRSMGGRLKAQLISRWKGFRSVADLPVLDEPFHLDGGGVSEDYQSIGGYIGRPRATEGPVRKPCFWQGRLIGGAGHASINNHRRRDRS